MIDHAKESLDYVLRSGEFARIPDVAIFKEHELKDRAGRVVRRVDKAELERIALVGNQRATETGDLCPIGPGHTQDDAPEESQPPIWGYLHRYSVRRHKDGKWYLHADEYVRRRIETRDGKVVDGERYVKSFPRRSPEYWQADHLIDWLALLRITPKLDLGMVAYSRAYYDRGGPAAYANAKGKLRYSMEDHMDLEQETAPPADPTLPPDASVDIDDNEPMPQDAQDMPPEEKERYSKSLFGMPHAHVHKLFSHLHKKYSKEAGCEDDGMGAEPERYEAAAPSATNTFIPGTDDKDKVRMSKTQPDLAPSRYQREVADLRKEISVLRSENAEIKKNGRLDRFSKRLTELAVVDGYDFSPEEELKDCEEMTDAAFDKHCERIVKRYAKAPVGGDLIRFSREREFPAGGNGVTPELANKAKSLAARKGIGFDEALAELRPAK